MKDNDHDNARTCLMHIMSMIVRIVSHESAIISLATLACVCACVDLVPIDKLPHVTARIALIIYLIAVACVALYIAIVHAYIHVKRETQIVYITTESGITITAAVLAIVSSLLALHAHSQLKYVTDMTYDIIELDVLAIINFCTLCLTQWRPIARQSRLVKCTLSFNGSDTHASLTTSECQDDSSNDMTH